MKRMIYLLGILTLFISCSSELETFSENESRQSENLLDYSISLDEAVASANKLLDQLEGATRAGERKVVSVSSILYRPIK